MPTKPLGVAILGAGIFAREAHLPAISLSVKSGLVKLQAVYSRSHASASALAELASSTLNLQSKLPVYSDDGSKEAAGSLDELLMRSDVEAVIVVLPINSQPDVVLRAMKAGKHVLSEKPVAKDVNSALNLVEIYEKEYKPKGLTWRIAENFECEPGIIAAAEAIRSGKIGKVALFKLSGMNYISQDNKYYKTSWRTVPDYQGGFILDGGVHSAALLRTILPDPIISVTGHASLTKEWLGPHDSIQSILRTSSGAHGIFELSWASPVNGQGTHGNGTEVTGTEGYLRIVNQNVVPKDGGSDPAPHYVMRIVTADGREEVNEYKSQGVEKEIECFAKVVLGEADEGKGVPRGAVRDVAVIEASLQSNGNLVDLTRLLKEG